MFCCIQTVYLSSCGAHFSWVSEMWSLDSVCFFILKFESYSRDVRNFIANLICASRCSAAIIFRKIFSSSMIDLGKLNCGMLFHSQPKSFSICFFEFLKVSSAANSSKKCGDFFCNCLSTCVRL